MSIKIKDFKTNEINFYCPNTGKCVRTMEFFEYVGKNSSEIIEYNEKNVSDNLGRIIIEKCPYCGEKHEFEVKL